MATKVLSLRVPEELAEWADEYAAARGVPRQELLENALQSFREDCEAGVPEFRERVRRVVSAGEREPGEPKPSREDFARACAERSELFANLRTPDSVKGIKPKERP